MTQLKTSRFNIFANLSSDRTACYNTLKDSLVMLSNQTAAHLKSSEIEALKNDEKEDLTQAGILVPNELNELDVYRFRRERQRFKDPRTHIFLTVTGACNCRCLYCFAADSLPKKSMGLKEAVAIRRFVQDRVIANNSKMLQIDFFGGEPMLYWDLLESEMTYYEKLASQFNLHLMFRIYTNGTLLPENPGPTLKSHPIKDLQITLDGPEKVHNHLRPLKSGKNAFRKIIENLKILDQENVPVYLRLNFDQKSHFQLPELLEFLKNEGLMRVPIEFFPVQAMSHACTGYKDAIDKRQLIKILPILWQAAMDLGFRVPLRPNPRYLYCSASCESSYVINSELNIYKCALLQCSKEYAIGQINGGVSNSNSASEYFQWMTRDATRLERCRKCPSLPICSGGCGGSARFKFESGQQSNCYELQPAILRQRLKMYCLQNYPEEARVSG